MGVIKVGKFGGTSMDALGEVAGVIEHTMLTAKEGKEVDAVAVTVSAFGGITSKTLLALQKIRDLCLSGEDVGSEKLDFTDEKIKIAEAVVLEIFAKPLEILRKEFEPEFCQKIEKELFNVLVFRAMEKVKAVLKDSEDEDCLPYSYKSLEAYFLKLGEYISASLLVEKLNTRNKIAQLVDLTSLLGPKNKIISEEDLVSLIGAEVIKSIHEGKIPVIPGWFGPETLERYGRGYTEMMMCFVGRALAFYFPNAVELEIWKEFPIGAADPKRLMGMGLEESQKLLTALSYEELAELLAGQFKAIHPGAVKAVLKATGESRLPLRFGNTFIPDMQSTSILPERDRTTDVGLLQSIAVKDGVIIISLEAPDMISTLEDSEGFTRKIAEICEKLGQSIDVIATSANAITFTLDRFRDGVEVGGEKAISALIEKISNEKGVSKVERIIGEFSAIVCVGEQMKELRGVADYAGLLLSTVADVPVMLRSQSKSRAITFVVRTEEVNDAFAALYKGLVLKTKEEFFQLRTKLKQSLASFLG